MNKLFIIGNLTKDPEKRVTPSGISVCTFTVAVDRRRRGQQKESDYFRVTAWRELADSCGEYLAKGRKVGVAGSVSASAYVGQDGKPKATIEVDAQEVEFLTPKERDMHINIVEKDTPAVDKSGFVDVTDETLPWE